MKTSSRAPIAKISRPKVAGVIQRERLFLQIDEALHKPVIWISSPGGSGKTTLICSYIDSRRLPCLWYQVDARDADIATFFYYMGMAAKALMPKRYSLPLLTPEYLQNIPVFARNYFELLYNSMKRVAAGRQMLIVFDNYQEAHEDSRFHDVIDHGLDIVPSWVRIVVVSRKSQPHQLMRQLANNRIGNIGWEDLRLARDEFGEMVKAGWRQVKEEMIDDLYARTDGWAAGLVLMMEQFRKGGGTAQHGGDCPRGRTPDTIFDYFAGEAFRGMNEVTQTFLLQTSLLPKMTVYMAQRLTGSSAARDILSSLCRNNYFTQRHRQPVDVYQYHPLFREFLLSRITGAFPPDERAELKKKAAGLLEKDGQVEEAADLLYRTRELDLFAELILRQAESFIATGRHGLLTEWIGYLPEEMIERQPWLMFWLGRGMTALNPAVAQDYFARSFRLFKERNERTGMLRAWSSVVNAALVVGKFAVLDEWIPEMEGILKQDPTFPSSDLETMVTMSMFNALAVRQPHHPDMPAYNEKAVAIFMQTNLERAIYFSAASHLNLYNLWSGDYPRATMVVDKLRETLRASGVSDLFTIGGMRSIALYEMAVGDKEGCISAVEDGLRVAAKTGIHVWDCHALDIAISSALSDEDMETALKLMEQYEARSDHARLFDRGFYKALRAWKHVIEGDPASAVEIQRIGLSMLDEVGFPYGQFLAYIMLSDMLHEAGEKGESAQYLEKAYALVRATGSGFIEWMCFMYDAKMSLDDGDEDKALGCLRRGLTAGREGGFVNCIYWRRPVMTRLCIKALEAGIETDYVLKLIRKRNLMPETPPLEIEAWPWPLKIFTFGGFRLEREGKPVPFSGKVQQKPLTMLKALIALGGREVPEEQITDALWPDAEGDVAHSAFSTTLQRLRKLLGKDSAIRLHEGKLGLDNRQCWVDVWTFERIFKQTAGDCPSLRTERSEVVEEGLYPKCIQLADKAISLYKGHFLPDERGEAWSLSMRERMKNKYLRLITGLGEYHQRKGQWKKAVEHYLRGLKVDELVEEFYQNLMLCYQELGLNAEALSVYRRCRNTLGAFGIEPSFKTEGMYNDLRKR